MLEAAGSGNLPHISSDALGECVAEYPVLLSLLNQIPKGFQALEYSWLGGSTFRTKSERLLGKSNNHMNRF